MPSNSWNWLASAFMRPLCPPTSRTPTVGYDSAEFSDRTGRGLLVDLHVLDGTAVYEHDFVVLVSGLTIFMLGLVSEQIALLRMHRTERTGEATEYRDNTGS